MIRPNAFFLFSVFHIWNIFLLHVVISQLFIFFNGRYFSYDLQIIVFYVYLAVCLFFKLKIENVKWSTLLCCWATILTWNPFSNYALN